MAAKDPNHLPPSNGRAAGWIGVAALALGAGVMLRDGFQSSDLLGISLLAFFSWLIWVAVIWTHATIGDEELVLHNAFHTTRVPFATIGRAEVRLTLLLDVGEKKPISFAGLSRTRREISRNAPPDPINNYPDLVEQRLEHLATEARERGAAQGPAVREPSWWRIGIFLGLAALVVAAALLT